MAAGESGAGDESADPREEAREEARQLAARVRTNLAARARSGALGVPRGGVVVVTPKQAAPLRAPGNRPSGPPVNPPAIEDVVAAAPALYQLPTIREEIGDCQRCKLAGGRKKIVFGVGNPNAHLVFVGEAPGADEDEQGEPFVGKAGQLLTKMIEAMGYRREDVYICNVIKCRPPGNRNPEPDEVASCEPFLKKQLGAIRPRMIVTLGKFAAQCLLRDDTPISRLRGSFRTYEGVSLMPTFHPAYLLRDPSKKKETWADLKAVNAALKRLGLEPPHPPAA